MHPQPTKSNRSTGEKLRALANKLNDGNKLGICSLLLVAGLAVTLAVMSQEAKILNRESEGEIRTDFFSQKSQRFGVKLNKTDVSPENHETWEWAIGDRNPIKDRYLMSAQVHSVHAKGDKPYAILYVLKKENTPDLAIIPKDILHEEAWEKILKATPRPEFATEWGYKIPTTLGEKTKYGSTDAFKNAVADAIREEILKNLPQPSMPIKRTITDTQGRSIQGTILSKTAETIRFQREGTAKPVDIKLETLSADDQAVIASLINKDERKTSVILVLYHDPSAEDYHRAKPLRDWLIQKGFDVTLGISATERTTIQSRRARCQIPEVEKAVLIQPAAIVDHFDIVWFERFTPYDKDETNHFSIFNRRSQQKRLAIIPTWEDMTQKGRFVSEEEYCRRATLASAKSERDIAFVRTDENVIFYSSKYPVTSDEKSWNRVSKKIGETPR